MCGRGVRSILLLPLVARCIWRMFLKDDLLKSAKNIYIS